MKLIGKQNIDYVSKKTNQQVKGVSLHCTTTRSGVEGSAVETVFISEKSDMFKEVVAIPIGSEIKCSYNRWGSVDSVQACK